MVAILAAGALAIDLGSTLVERREARNAADHAALAAAWAECEGANPQTAANESVARNGYSAGDLTLQKVAAGKYMATVDTSVSMTFGGAVGIGSVDVSGEATALCDSGGTGTANAIYAFGDTCTIDPLGKIQLDFSGSNNRVYGGIHSNLNIWISGSNNDLGLGNGTPPVDPVTYVTEIGDKVEEQEFDAGYPQQTNAEPAPDWLDVNDYAPGGTAAAWAAGQGKYFSFTRKVTSDDITSDGLYYTTDEIDLVDGNIDWDITMVARGSIKVSGSNQTLDPFVDGVLAFGAIPYGGIDQCDKFVVAMSGSANEWTGLIYAPYGLIEFSGSDNSALTGALLGYAVRINGSNQTIIADPSLFPYEGDAPKLLE